MITQEESKGRARRARLEILPLRFVECQRLEEMTAVRHCSIESSVLSKIFHRVGIMHGAEFIVVAMGKRPVSPANLGR